MHVVVDFMKTMFVNGVGLAAWISVLLLVNMAVPLLFLSTAEGQLVFAAAMAGALTQMAIFASKGFVRLLGIGHIYWVPLLAWLWTRLDGDGVDGPLRFWMVSVILLNGVSLIIDALDVARFIAGERTPHLRSG